ncbi:hypothetical protein LEP1GSC058_2169 [Leptospira fainei serovar Hurstbridge str. BUT 6]|uniref:Uncharacterized protein n=1 Tax=Leptospira fainei serovar Hurstbridge str. BUT 6 TaxID=1193011 RepID=S3W5V5_9LEPT|nr:hypothetical protein LEP1GSC058_2169 [Leptospira fainei serovar Hurstbridge str. BUT 6]
MIRWNRSDMPDFLMLYYSYILEYCISFREISQRFTNL